MHKDWTDLLITVAINLPMAILMIVIIYTEYFRKSPPTTVWLDTTAANQDYPCILYSACEKNRKHY